jgi:hypothetical protein
MKYYKCHAFDNKLTKKERYWFFRTDDNGILWWWSAKHKGFVPHNFDFEYMSAVYDMNEMSDEDAFLELL